jgi:hypothetical protein
VAPGATVLDYSDAVFGSFPLVMSLIALTTFLLLVRAFRSLLLPLKAVLLNVVSVAATFGFVVLFWQNGFGSEAVFGIEETGAVTFWLPVLIFAFLFGLSMDYEVFILARMREEYDRTGSTRTAVIEGLGRTGRLVTCAALILFLAFVALAGVPGTDVKMLATALGVGILIDATIVRALLVPALVSLLGSWNWWLPAWLARPLRVEPSPRRVEPVFVPGQRDETRSLPPRGPATDSEQDERPHQDAAADRDDQRCRRGRQHGRGAGRQAGGAAGGGARCQCLHAVAGADQQQAGDHERDRHPRGRRRRPGRSRTRPGRGRCRRAGRSAPTGSGPCRRPARRRAGPLRPLPFSGRAWVWLNSPCECGSPTAWSCEWSWVAWSWACGWSCVVVRVVVVGRVVVVVVVRVVVLRGRAGSRRARRHELAVVHVRGAGAGRRRRAARSSTAPMPMSSTPLAVPSTG